VPAKNMLRISIVLASFVAVAAIKIDSLPIKTDARPRAAPLLALRGGGALGTPLSPLELTEAGMGVIYWVQIALLPQVWAQTNLGVTMDATASTITTLVGAILFSLRGTLYIVRSKAPELKKDLDGFSAIAWAYCCATLFFPGNVWLYPNGFWPNLVICGGFSIAFGLRYLGVF